MASSSQKAGPFKSIQNKMDENRKKFEKEKKEKEERERAAQEQYWKEVKKRNQERERMAQSSVVDLVVEIAEGTPDVHEGELPRPVTSLVGHIDPMDGKKEMRSISSARLPQKSSLDVPEHTNRSVTSEPIPEHGDPLTTPSSRSEEPAFNLPQVSESKAKKIDALNISQKQLEAQESSIERSSDWSAEIGSGHTSVGPSPVPETVREAEQPAMVEIKIDEPSVEKPKDIGNGTKESPIDLNAVPYVPAQASTTVPAEHLIPVQKSKCCCIM